jgi:hypothetical protein
VRARAAATISIEAFRPPVSVRTHPGWTAVMFSAAFDALQPSSQFAP